jgi:membrane-bound serine protease (ClpP class)
MCILGLLWATGSRAADGDVESKPIGKATPKGNATAKTPPAVAPKIDGPKTMAPSPKPTQGKAKVVYILPVRWDIMPPLLHLLDRGFKEAMDGGADLVILDIHTNGGRVDVTEKILKMIDQYNGEVIAFVNDKAISAGALISVGAKTIYLKPGGRIGDAAPILMSPGGGGAQELPGTMEEKINSYVRSLARREAQENGHSVEIVEAMINKERELKIADKVVCPKGELLTLTAKDAEEIGFSSGTVKDIDALLEARGLYDDKTGQRADLEKQGLSSVKVIRVEKSSAEEIAYWFDSISPILLIIGMIGIYLEVKTPGFGVPGIIGITALVFYFLGSSIAHFTGNEQMILCLLLFLLGLGLIIVELYVMPGMAVFGVLGLLAVVVALVIAPIDLGNPPSNLPVPPIPTWPVELKVSIQNLIIAFFGTGAVAIVLSRYLPQTRLFQEMVPASASGMESVAALDEEKAAQIGQKGVADSVLRPSGRALFGNEMRDVMTEGDLIEAGARVRIIGHSGSTAVVVAD